MFSFAAHSQKVDYAALLKEDEDSDVVLSTDDDLVDDKKAGGDAGSDDDANMFDSLKESAPAKTTAAAATKRKLGPKTAEIKPNAKRIKKRPVDSDDSGSDDFVPTKSVIILNGTF